MKLTAIRSAAFGPNPEFPEYTGVAAFYAERSRPYGVRVDTDAALTGNRNSYAYLSTQILALLPEPPDLVVVAHALPDCGVENSVAGSVQEFLTGQPMTFAVTEQGRTTGFAALQAAEAMSRAGYRRVAVLALDQGTILYSDPALAGLDAEADHAVGLLFTADGSAELSAIRHLTGVGAEEIGPVAAAELGKLASSVRAGDVVFVLGGGLVHDGLDSELAGALGAEGHSDGRFRVRRAPAGQPCTAVWSEVAVELEAPSASARTVVVAEHDPELRCFSLLSLDIPPSWGAP